jgi:hypothetical protein
MERVPDTAMLEKLGFAATWFPMKLEIELKGVEGPIEVQLVDKKHDIFGKVESTWKE